MYPRVITSSAVSQRQSIMSRTGWPSTLVMMQPGVKPASSAGLSGSTDSMTAFGGSGSAALATARWTAQPASPHPEEDKCPRQHRLSASVHPYAVDFSQHIMVACRTRSGRPAERAARKISATGDEDLRRGERHEGVADAAVLALADGHGLVAVHDQPIGGCLDHMLHVRQDSFCGSARSCRAAAAQARTSAAYDSSTRVSESLTSTFRPMLFTYTTSTGSTMCTVPAVRSASGLSRAMAVQTEQLVQGVARLGGRIGRQQQILMVGAVHRRSVGGARGAVHGQRKDAAVLQLAHQRYAGALVGGRTPEKHRERPRERTSHRCADSARRACAPGKTRSSPAGSAPAQGCCSISVRSAAASGTASSTSNILHMVATSTSRSRAGAFAAPVRLRFMLQG